MLIVYIVLLCTLAALALMAAMPVAFVPCFLFFFPLLALYSTFSGDHCAPLRHLPVVKFCLGARFGAAPRPLRRTTIYACEPHGLCCSHLSLFANPGSELNDDQCMPVHVVADWRAFLVPLVREVYALVGIITNLRFQMAAALSRGDSLALSPSGVAGKELAVHCSDVRGGAISVLRRRRVPGFVRMAAQYNCDIVPVLSRDENVAYGKPASDAGQPPKWWATTSVSGRWIFFPEQAEMLVDCGEPIDCSGVDHLDDFALQGLADKYYEQLRKLAPRGRELVVVDRTDSDK